MPILITIALVLWTTARHEASHALAAILDGATINEIKLLPGIHPELGFYFGYVDHTGEPNWLTNGAPFIADLLVMALAFPLLRGVASTRGRFLILLLGFVSPLIDLAYNYQGGLWRPGTDVHDLSSELPDLYVHASFIVAIVFGVLMMRVGWRAHREPSF